ncbi:MAG: hypothetical protein ABI723_15925 [Bacteroidia bacterium]
MSTEEIKSIIHEGIENIDDLDFLETIQSLINEKYLAKPAPHLTDKQIEHLKRSREQIKNGEFHTNDEVKKMMTEWLKK